MKVSIINCTKEEIVDTLNVNECQNDGMLEILYNTIIAFLFEAIVYKIGNNLIKKICGDETNESKGNLKKSDIPSIGEKSIAPQERLSDTGPLKRGRRAARSAPAAIAPGREMTFNVRQPAPFPARTRSARSVHPRDPMEVNEIVVSSDDIERENPLFNYLLYYIMGGFLLVALRIPFYSVYFVVYIGAPIIAYASEFVIFDL